MFQTTKYGPEDLLVMKTKVSTVKGTKEGKVQTVEALADSGASIILWYLAKKVNMMIFEKGDATLKDASHKNMDVRGRGDIMVQEEHGIQHKIKVLVSTDFSQDELVVPVQQHYGRPMECTYGSEGEEGKSERSPAIPGREI